MCVEFHGVNIQNITLPRKNMKSGLDAVKAFSIAQVLEKKKREKRTLRIIITIHILKSNS